MKHEHLKQFEIETNAVKVLRRAREMIESGWCQGIAFRPSKIGAEWAVGTERCASQAIMDAAFQPDCGSMRDNALEAERLFILAIGFLNNSIPVWNDDPCRTKAEVLAAFDRAIRIAS